VKRSSWQLALDGRRQALDEKASLLAGVTDINRGTETMIKYDSESLSQWIEAAQGQRPADLCLRRCKLVNVISGTIEEVDLAIYDGTVLGWGDYDAEQVIDASAFYVCPGFIDGHIHLESTMLSPSQFCAAVLPWGTTAVVADPHEIANVLGLDGIRYFLQATRKLPLDVYFNLPSCVPASPLETSGANLRAADLFSLLPHDQLLGLAEMMNFPGVLHTSPEVMDKLVLFQEHSRDGHAPCLGGQPLNGYLAAGIGSDHECTSLPEAREKLAKGMAIMIREGSQSKDLAALLPLVDQHTWPQCMLVSDDRHPDDLLREGHMNAIVNQAMASGMDPVLALTLATWTATRYFRLPRKGALAPGFQADFTMSPTLNPWNPQRVFKNGVEVARAGKLLANPQEWPQPSLPPSPMNVTRLALEDLIVPAQPGSLRVIGVQEGTILTKKLVLAPKIEGSTVIADSARDVLKLVVYNRYVPDRPPAVGFVQGLGLRRGAIATTVAHDSHNLIAAGGDDRDIIHVVDAVRKLGGGMAIGTAGGPLETLALPLAGLMSDQPLQRVVERLEALKGLAARWGSALTNPFMALSFLALPVIPELKLTDSGLVDVSLFSFVSLFEAD
jgi:adenine deaminase